MRRRMDSAAPPADWATTASRPEVVRTPLRTRLSWHGDVDEAVQTLEATARAFFMEMHRLVPVEEAKPAGVARRWAGAAWGRRPGLSELPAIPGARVAPGVGA